MFTIRQIRSKQVKIDLERSELDKRVYNVLPFLVHKTSNNLFTCKTCDYMQKRHACKYHVYSITKC